MSAVFDTPLNGLGVIPLVSSVEGLSMSKSYRDALNVLVSACRGKQNCLILHQREGEQLSIRTVVISDPSLSWMLTLGWTVNSGLHLKNTVETK